MPRIVIDASPPEISFRDRLSGSVGGMSNLAAALLENPRVSDEELEMTRLERQAKLDELRARAELRRAQAAKAGGAAAGEAADYAPDHVIKRVQERADQEALVTKIKTPRTTSPGWLSRLFGEKPEQVVDEEPVAKLNELNGKLEVQRPQEYQKILEKHLREAGIDPVTYRQSLAAATGQGKPADGPATAAPALKTAATAAVPAPTPRFSSVQELQQDSQRRVQAAAQADRERAELAAMPGTGIGPSGDRMTPEEAAQLRQEREARTEPATAAPVAPVERAKQALGVLAPLIEQNAADAPTVETLRRMVVLWGKNDQQGMAKLITEAGTEARKGIQGTAIAEERAQRFAEVAATVPEMKMVVIGKEYGTPEEQQLRYWQNQLLAAWPEWDRTALREDIFPRLRVGQRGQVTLAQPTDAGAATKRFQVLEEAVRALTQGGADRAR